MKNLSLLVLLVALSSLATTLSAQTLTGKASYYAERFHGRPTSTGEIYNMDAYTAASKEFPVGTILQVTNVANNRVTQVRINDCGPSTEGRIIDLSRAAAAQIDLLRAGVAVVKLKVLRLGTEGMPCNRSKQDLAASTTPKTGTSVPVVGTYSTVSTPVPADATSSASEDSSLPTGTDEVFSLYGVQVAAYGKVENADKFITENTNLGYLFKRTDAKFTRVFVGPFLDRNEAEAVVTDLKTRKINGIVRRVQ
ncbi:MAG: septal ring lytic transglycosylase RlpA family protein [Bacteroidota bacterium]